MANKPYQDEDWLREQYVEKGRTVTDIAEQFDMTNPGITHWMDKYGIERRSNKEAQKPDKPYTDEEWLLEQYLEKENSLHDIAAECDVTGAVILKWARRFDIPRRNTTDHFKNNEVTTAYVSGDFGGLPGGYIRYQARVPNTDTPKSVHEHQLVMLREGADPHKVFSDGEYNIHHKNGIKWDNREENLELITATEHRKHHNKDRERTDTGEYK